MQFWRVLMTAVVALGVAVAASAQDGRPGDGPPPEVAPPPEATAAPEAIRIATFNVEDIRREHVEDLNHPESARLRAVATIIQRLQPDILLLTEVATGQFQNIIGEWTVQMANSPADHFAVNYLRVSQQEGCLEGIDYEVFVAKSNTGIHSGLDLNRDGIVDPGATGRVYGEDCLGYGEFPGQYGMALLVRRDRGLSIDRRNVRTFREFLWKNMPGALLPPVPEGDDFDERIGGWYSDEALAVLPLSSKSHWDVPVRVGDGRVVHVLASHPTPPVFDGAEDRNGRRNHDEIRFWAEYLDGAEWIVDDRGGRGGLAEGALFVIAGDLNADPAPGKGDSRGNPVGTWLLGNDRVQGDVVPRSRTEIPGVAGIPGMEAADTARFRMRVDYVLPSVGMEVVGSGVFRSVRDWAGTECKAVLADERHQRETGKFPSDHFPVWVDVVIGGGE